MWFLYVAPTALTLAFFTLLRATEMAKEKFFQWVYPLEFPVVLLYDCFVSVVQPVAFTLHDVVHGLGIELAIIDSDVCLDRTGHFDANETAASKRRLHVSDTS